jgi:tetratricopeptide (TPR) repeat protein
MNCFNQQRNRKLRTKVCFIVSVIAALIIGGGCHRAGNDEVLSKGLELLDSGQYKDAREMLDRATTIHSNSVSAFYGLGYSCWKLNDIPAAQKALTRASELSKRDTRPAELLAHILLENGDITGADLILAQIENPTPSSLTLRAVIARKAGSTDLARSYLGEALELNKDYPPALYNLAVLYRDIEKDNREALLYYKHFKEVAPHDMHADESPQAFVKSAFGDSDRGISAGTPTNDAPIEPTQDDLSGTDRHATATPNSGPRKSEKQAVAESLKSAREALARDDADVALILLKKSVAEHPDNPDIIWALAELYDKNLGNRPKAAGMYKKFRIMFPRDPRAAKAKQRLAAISTHNKPVRQSTPATKKTAEEYFRMGLDLYNKKQWSKSISAYKKGLRMHPKSDRIAYNLGLAYKANGDLVNATKAFKVALQIKPDKVNALYMLGLTEMEQKNYDAALERFNKLLRIQPDFAQAHYLLGVVYQREKRPDMTAIHFERFLKLSPSGKSADDARRWLDKHKVN